MSRVAHWTEGRVRSLGRDGWMHDQRQSAGLRNDRIAHRHWMQDLVRIDAVRPILPVTEEFKTVFGYSG